MRQRFFIKRSSLPFAESALLLFFLLSSICTYAQSAHTGKVVDEKNEPIIGASVLIKGTSKGTVTDIGGNFSITAMPQQTIVISYIGYLSKEFVVSSMDIKTPITLIEDSHNLSEVVVVGYGSQKKETLTGAITVIDNKIIQDKGSLSSPLQAMQGQVPGVTITRNSTAPGDESWSMKLRGGVSANNADPLIVIDGVAYESMNALRNINPDDIESINFLKDASAAIYGSRAAGGVVLISTKKAIEGKIKINYEGSFSVKKVGLQPELMSLSEWADAVIQARTNDGYTASDTWIKYAKLALANQGHYIDLKNSANPFGSAFTDVKDLVFMDTNWSDILFDDANSTQHNISLSGGTSKNLYRLSLGYLYDGSNLVWGINNNQRYNLRLSNSIQLNDRIKLESVIAYNRQNQVAPSYLGNTLTGSYPQPGLPAATIDGKPYSWGTWLSPIWYAELGGENKLRVSEVNISEQLSVNLIKNLTWMSVLGYNTSAAQRDVKKMAITSYNYAGTEVNTGPSVSSQSKSSYSSTSASRDFYSLASYLNYKKTFGQKHNTNVMAGTQYELTEYDYFGASVLDIQNSLETVNGAGTVSLVNGGGTKWHEAILSYYSRLNYDYASKYLLEANLRYDGSSKFQSGRWAMFYGLSGGWRISEENFMKSTKWVNNLKLRLSYGIVGNQSGIDRYEGSQYYNFVSQGGVLIGATKASYITTNGKIASNGREWERINNANIGLDFSLFNGKLSGTFEVFDKRNNNMLIIVSYPAILGDGAGYSNAGKFEAKGYEGQLSWADRIGKVGYRIGGTLTYADNKLVDIGGTNIMSSGFVSQQQGYALNSVFGLIYTGKVQNEEQRQKYLARYLAGNTIGLTNQLRIGDNMFEDHNADGVLDYKDFVNLGSDDPKFSFSFNVGLEWKNFDLSAVFQGVAKRTIFRTGSNNGNEIYRIPMKAVYLNTSNQSVGNVWSTDNPNGFYPTYTSNSVINNYNYQASSWSVEDGSYVRLKSLILGYNVPKSFAMKTKTFEACRIYISGADLWEYSKIKDGWDPEASRTVSDAGRFPFVRTVTFGINLTF